MSWPTPLGPPQGPTAPAPPWDALLQAEVRGATASRWARAVGAPIAIDAAASRSGPPPPAAWAVWEGPNQVTGWFAVERRWLHQVFAQLTGTSPVPGAAPLSPAEEGVFAWLAGAALDALPTPVALVGVHGGDPDWPLPRPTGAALDWRLSLGARPGRARWWVPAQPSERSPRAMASLPVVVAARAEVRLDPRRPPRPGDLLPLSRGLALWTGPGPLCPLTLTRGRLTVAPEPSMTPPALETLPVVLTVSLGQVTLPAGQLAGLRPDDTVPIQVEDPPVVQLTAGDVPVAQGVLVQAGGGGLAVQITRMLLTPP